MSRLEDISCSRGAFGGRISFQTSGKQDRDRFASKGVSA
jgi:hypothetical protein